MDESIHTGKGRCSIIDASEHSWHCQIHCRTTAMLCPSPYTMSHKHECVSRALEICLTVLCVCRVCNYSHTLLMQGVTARTQSIASLKLYLVSHLTAFAMTGWQYKLSCGDNRRMVQEWGHCRIQIVGNSGWQHPTAHWRLPADVSMCELQVVLQ